MGWDGIGLGSISLERGEVGKNMMGFEEMGRGAMGWDGARQSGVGKDQMGWSRKGRDVSGHDSKR